VICENNGYAYSTPTSRQTAVRFLVDKAAGYGVPGVQADGNDVLAVYEVTRTALERARAGGGPTLVELMTFRRKGHAEHDNQSYVSQEELDSWARKDPLDGYVRRLTQSGWATPEELEAIDSRILGELDTAVAACENEPFPAPQSALDGVYADPPRAESEWYRRL
jgi:pyruvate dehydrogenase E1 component alpha subunit/2-oxoisovalerate dehydrogenase E1 component alpha subunit